MIAIPSIIAQTCAPARLNQMGRGSETAPLFLRQTALHSAETRLGAMPKLPPRNCARARWAPLQSDWAASADQGSPNWKFLNLANALSWPASLGAESHPFQGWGDRRRRGLPVPPLGLRARGAPTLLPTKHQTKDPSP